MPVSPTARMTVPLGTRRKLRDLKQGELQMQELRPDVLDDDPGRTNESDVDKRVVAPTETLDDRDSKEQEFRVEEELSCSNTDFGGKDPAL